MNRRRRSWAFLVRPVLFLVVSLVVARFAVSLVGDVEWREVVSALGRLSWTYLPVLAGLLLVRQTANSVPLVLFVPGLGFWRAFQSDLAANVVGTLAPPPGDIVIRASMFRSWGIAPADGMPGVTLNSLSFYLIRFSVPILGVLVLLDEDLSPAQIWLAVGSLVVAVLVVIVLVVVSRGERLAALLGRRAGRAAARLRGDVDPERWAAAAAAFRSRMSTRLLKGLPPSLGALTAMVITDGLIVLVALRLVGVDGGQLSASVVLGTFLLTYPLTALPLAGLGVLDAALIVAYTQVAGLDAEPEIVAALITWRVVTMLGTLMLGAGMLGLWKWKDGRAPARHEPLGTDVAGSRE